MDKELADLKDAKKALEEDLQHKLGDSIKEKETLQAGLMSRDAEIDILIHKVETS